MRVRLKRIEVRLNEKEYRHLERQLAVTGLTKSEFLRKLIMGTDIQPKPPDELKETYRLVANLTNNANQIAKIANATGYVDPNKIDGLLVMVDKCWQLMKKIC